MNKDAVIKMLEENASHFMTENTKMRNQLKLTEKGAQQNAEDVVSKTEFAEFKRTMVEAVNNLKSCFANVNERNGKNNSYNPPTRVLEETAMKETSLTSHTSNKQPSASNKPLTNNNLTFGSLRFSANNPQTVENSPDETGRSIPFRTADQTEKIHIFSSSMLRDVSEDDFNSKLLHGTAKIHLHRGKKANDIKERVQEQLLSERTNSVIILAGGNDLPTSRKNPTAPEDIAEKIVSIGVDCHDAGIPAEKIHISSILPRQEAYMQVRRMKINDAIREKCKKYKFTFIENKNILLSRHIGKDGVHLNRTGTTRVANNFLEILNGTVMNDRVSDELVGPAITGGTNIDGADIANRVTDELVGSAITGRTNIVGAEIVSRVTDELVCTANTGRSDIDCGVRD